jgi:hypothetical protein
MEWTPDGEYCLHLDASGPAPLIANVKPLHNMRLITTILLALSAAGCCTHHQQASAPSGPVTIAEAQSIASGYIVAARGSCGTGTGAVQDGGEFWCVQTVYGLGERPGPELRIDKITRHVTVVQEASR